ncbi:MAG: T9SS type A sorting domain-containing protein [Ignavibacteria bacterium]|nr:T9SS type A sorting domain-containing protein [Ignavibacteria bacterium]
MKKMFFFIVAAFLANVTLAQNISIQFKVNMSVQAKKGLFTPGTDAVKLAGNFNGWSNGGTVLTGPDADTVYTVTIDTFTVGDALAFKFIKGADGWENDPNREFTVTGAGVYSGWFNNDSVFSAISPVAVTFSCNMEYEIVSGRFNPATDTLSARGSHNGWSGNDMMVPSSSDPNYYEITRTLQVALNETINYKYAYLSPGGTTWENDPNKTYTITQDDITAGSAFTERTFNDLGLDNITNYPVTIKFTVNVVGAVSSVTGQPFTSITDVRLCGANAPLKWPDGGWPDADSAKTIKLYDNGTNGDVTANDNIWSRDVVFPQYSPLRIQYKYGANWGLPTNTGSNDNESSIGTDHFINMQSNMNSARVANQWSVMGDHDLLDIVLDVRDLNSGVPSVYELGQNYPNPFNPSTSIRFAIPEAGMVTMKVYNALGQEVANLVNEFRNAGTHVVDFNASNLTSGIYFYSVTSNNFTSTKKMLLLK